jgi:hypothetical protein
MSRFPSCASSRLANRKTRVERYPLVKESANWKSERREKRKERRGTRGRGGGKMWEDEHLSIKSIGRGG